MVFKWKKRRKELTGCFYVHPVLFQRSYSVSQSMIHVSYIRKEHIDRLVRMKKEHLLELGKFVHGRCNQWRDLGIPSRLMKQERILVWYRGVEGRFLFSKMGIDST